MEKEQTKFASFKAQPYVPSNASPIASSRIISSKTPTEATGFKLHSEQRFLEKTQRKNQKLEQEMLTTPISTPNEKRRPFAISRVQNTNNTPSRPITSKKGMIVNIIEKSQMLGDENIPILNVN